MSALGHIARWLRSLVGSRRTGADLSELPLPPYDMRRLVGPTDPAAFDNPSGELVYPFLDPSAYEAVFDFGCGCGRVARQLIQQRPQPDRYVGVDLHRGMIEWCKRNLASAAPQFAFVHHDVAHQFFNPGRDKPHVLAFPAKNATFTLVHALSVFTHLTQAQAAHYLREVARVLRGDGVVVSSWFLFDRREFPMLQGDNAALYVSYEDPGAAVIYDRGWVRAQAAEAGLVITATHLPWLRGYQWILELRPEQAGFPEVEIPVDTAPIGSIDLAGMPDDPSRLGLED